MKWEQDKIKEVFDMMCDYIASGKSLNAALRLKGTPDKNTFYKWIDYTKHNEPSEELKSLCNDRFNQYACARQERADVMFEEIITISEQRDDCSYFDESGNKRIDSSAVQAKRVEIDTKKWALSKMWPRKYGDKIDVTTDGEKINATPSKIEVNIVRNKDTDTSDPGI